ncbi:hypothetical protein KY290_025288 [Solanum tuberosum]|uniref:CCHC-type domain-containing protein n=1 Tax=Solanum tuberosum TaxID=4113 RepID=A0ABQ7UV75_SOLTU|nr:hypothetical protein KY290_025288 [Solanum tuberosum]
MEINNNVRFHEKMNDVTIVEKIPHSLTPHYDYVVYSIKESKDIDELSLDELGRSRGRGRGRGNPGNRDGGRNLRVNDDYNKGRGKNFEKSKVEYYRCHKFGHCQSDCYSRLPNQMDKKSNFVPPSLFPWSHLPLPPPIPKREMRT